MRSFFRSRRSRQGADSSHGVVPVTAAEAPELVDGSARPLATRLERVVVALAMYSQQLDERVAHIEEVVGRIERQGDDPIVHLPTQEDLLEVRLHSARVSAEVSRLGVELQARIDDLEQRMPDIVAEQEHRQRVNTLAESIIELSDALDTSPVDRHDDHGEWAATG